MKLYWKIIHFLDIILAWIVIINRQSYGTWHTFVCDRLVTMETDERSEQDDILTYQLCDENQRCELHHPIKKTQSTQSNEKSACDHISDIIHRRKSHNGANLKCFLARKCVFLTSCLFNARGSWWMTRHDKSNTLLSACLRLPGQNNGGWDGPSPM